MFVALARITAVLAICLLVVGASDAAPGSYQGPTDVAASPDGKSVFVLCRDARQIAVLDVAGGKVARKIDCPAPPTDLALSPDGKTLFVTCAAPEGTVVFVEAASGRVLATVPVGHTPTAPTVTPDGKRLYVCNRFNNNVSVIDVAAKKETAKVPVVREPIGSAVTPDGKLVFVTNHLPVDPADGYDVACVVTVIDTANNSTTGIRLPNGSSSLRDVCVSPDGQFAYVAHILSRYQMPTTQLERGWMNTNALSIIDVKTKKLLNTVLLDEIDLGASNPWGVACTADGASICVTHAGTHEMSAIDVAALHKKLAEALAKAKPAEKDGQYSGTSPGATSFVEVPNDLAFLVDLRRRIRLQSRTLYGWLDADPTEANGPRGLAIIGSKVYIAVYFSDVLAVVDLAADRHQQVSRIPLGPKPELTVQRRGEIHFHDAWLCFQHWQSCASCHPDARVDGLNWDLMNDGLGNPKNAKNMLLAHKTPPAMASSVRPDAEAGVRAGFTHILFTVQPEDVHKAVDEYLKSLTPVPSPYLVKGQLSEKAKKGKALFSSKRLGCLDCHPEPLYTDLELYDVGSRGKFDRRDTFDTPTLIECWRTAPYMHDGHYTTLKELFTTGKHAQPSGNEKPLTKDELDALIEFVKSL